MGTTVRIKWRERKRQRNKRESNGAIIVKTTQQLTIRKRVRGRGREQHRAGKIETVKLNN